MSARPAAVRRWWRPGSRSGARNVLPRYLATMERGAVGVRGPAPAGRGVPGPGVDGVRGVRRVLRARAGGVGRGGRRAAGAGGGRGGERLGGRLRVARGRYLGWTRCGAGGLAGSGTACCALRNPESGPPESTGDPAALSRRRSAAPGAGAPRSRASRAGAGSARRRPRPAPPRARRGRRGRADRGRRAPRTRAYPRCPANDASSVTHAPTIGCPAANPEGASRLHHVAADPLVGVALAQAPRERVVHRRSIPASRSPRAACSSPMPAHRVRLPTRVVDRASERERVLEYLGGAVRPARSATHTSPRSDSGSDRNAVQRSARVRSRASARVASAPSTVVAQQLAASLDGRRPRVSGARSRHRRRARSRPRTRRRPPRACRRRPNAGGPSPIGSARARARRRRRAPRRAAATPARARSPRAAAPT